MKKKGGKKNPISGLEPIIIFPLFFDCFLLVFRNVKTKEARDEDKKKTNTFDWTPHTHIFMISMGPGIWLEFKAASFPISFRWIPRWKRNSFYPSNDVFISIFFCCSLLPVRFQLSATVSTISIRRRRPCRLIRPRLTPSIPSISSIIISNSSSNSNSCTATQPPCCIRAGQPSLRSSSISIRR